MTPRYVGPIPILEKLGVVSYKHQLPESSRIHLVFHASQLKKAIGNYSAEASLPDGMEVELSETEELECVLASREINEAGRTVKQWLVK